MASYQGSTNYIWNQGDLLGRGVSGAVYKARHKKTGELYAVKTFDRMTSMQSLVGQRREFEVMRKVKHENIVRLLDIEEESVSRVKVIIMELCTGGSLLTLLDEPANSFGFDEKEFFTVLYDVASGLKYLRESGIVHRDIKPGNILLYKSEDGRHIYKLTDFGAARELEEEEQFMSLCGTEEYLYPDMYARAVLKQMKNQHFDASVDLWSLGVTLYHTATGNLPFRPFGGRNNREVMYAMTTQKESGVISGVQHKANGPIEYSRELPKTCQLTDGAKLLITPMLAGLMESNPDKMWTFNQFFDEVNQIKEKKLIHIFNTRDGNLLHVYLKQNDRLAQVYDAVAKQTDMSANMQHLIVDRGSIAEHLSPMVPVQHYPVTSDDDPIFLFLRSKQQLPGEVELAEPSLPPAPSSSSKHLNPSTDYNEVKAITKSLYLVKQYMKKYHHHQNLLLLAAKVFLFQLFAVIMRVQEFCKQFSNLLEETQKRIYCLRAQHKRNVRLLLRLFDGDRLNVPVVQQYRVEGDMAIDALLKSLNDIKEKVNKPLTSMKQLHREVIVQKQCDWQGIIRYSCQDKLVCLRKIGVLYDEVEKTTIAFKSEKRHHTIEEQIHKFEKWKANVNYEKGVTILTSNCYTTTKRMFEQFYKWFEGPCEMSQKLVTYESLLSNMAVSQENLSKSLDLCQTQLLDKLEHIQHQAKSIEDDYVVIKPEQLPFPRTGHNTGNHHTTDDKTELLNNIKREITDIEHHIQANGQLLNQLQNQ